ncbi:MAG TPA: prephenate dehydrogenase/arogenate dehydrogenase family protein [Pirellulaceae bacterium]|jgi:prephenate dehydrogenase
MRTWNNVAIIGVGLIGGSIGLALRERKLAGHVIGIGRREASLQAALARDCVTQTTTDIAVGVRQADLIIVCTPVDSIARFVQEAAAHCSPNCLITDAGSTKEQIVTAVEAACLKQSFIGSHPIAGSEKNGSEAATADLFNNRVAVITSTAKTNSAAITTINDFWQSLGSRVIEMSPAEHDAILARTSHLPHLLASALAAATSADDQTLALTGPGWSDTTRIAASEPDLWREIFLANRGATLKALADFETVLKTWREALLSANGPQITALLQEGKRRRDALGS